jgi:RimJ/RimL family protein N-acetyltransferase
MIELRIAKAADADHLFPMIYKSPVTDTILWDGPESIETYRESLAERGAQTTAGEAYFFTIVETSSCMPIGNCELRPEDGENIGSIGLWIGEPYQGRGYGTSVAQRLIHLGFQQLGLQKILAEVFVGNLPSRKIFEKNGMVLEQILPRKIVKRGATLDAWMFSITREHYLKLNSQGG